MTHQTRFESVQGGEPLFREGRGAYEIIIPISPNECC